MRVFPTSPMTTQAVIGPITEEKRRKENPALMRDSPYYAI